MENAKYQSAGQMIGAGPQQTARAGPPDFIIKYDRSPGLDVPRPAPIGSSDCEEAVYGTEADAIEAVQRLVESGQTTPGRVRVYQNMSPVIQTSVQFAPSSPKR